MMDRLITLGVGTSGTEEWMSTFQDISELARNLGEAHSYVNVTSTFVEEDDDEDYEQERLYHDEDTLLKVVTQINRAVPFLTTKEVTDIVNEIQNAGILFRERRT